MFTLFVTEVTPWGLGSDLSDHFVWSEYRGVNQTRFPPQGVKNFHSIYGVNYSLDFFFFYREKRPFFRVSKRVSRAWFERALRSHGLKSGFQIRKGPNHVPKRLSECDSFLCEHSHCVLPAGREIYSVLRDLYPLCPRIECPVGASCTIQKKQWPLAVARLHSFLIRNCHAFRVLIVVAYKAPSD